MIYDRKRLNFINFFIYEDTKKKKKNMDPYFKINVDDLNTS